MITYHERISLPSVILNREDVAKLLDILLDGFPSGERKLYLRVRTTTAEFDSETLDALLANNITERLKKVSFSARYFNIGEGVRYEASVYFGLAGEVSVDSHDEIWAKGKARQLHVFLKEKAAWYSWVSWGMFFCFGCFPILFLALSALELGPNKAIYLGLAFLSFAVGTSMLILHFKGLLFPSFKIHFSDVVTRNYPEYGAIFFSIIASAMTIIAIILQMMKS